MNAVSKYSKGIWKACRAILQPFAGGHGRYEWNTMKKRWYDTGTPTLVIKKKIRYNKEITPAEKRTDIKRWGTETGRRDAGRSLYEIKGDPWLI